MKKGQLSMVVDNDHFVNAFKIRFMNWDADGQPGGDLGIRNILRLLNGVEGLATRWACESHMDVPWENAVMSESERKSEMESNHRFYIMFVCDEQGLQFLMGFYGALRKHWYQIAGFNGIHELRLSFDSSLTPWQNQEGEVLGVFPHQPMVLEQNLDRHEKAYFIEQFEIVLKQVIAIWEKSPEGKVHEQA